MANRFVERCVLLRDHAEGLKDQVMFFKNRFMLVHQQPNVVKNAEWSRIRKVLQQALPEIPDISKEKGYDTFLSSVSITLIELERFYVMACEILRFNDGALDIIRKICTETTGFKFHQNPTLAWSFIDLFVSMIQLHKVWSLIQDRKMLLAAYAIAYNIQHKTSEPNISRLGPFLRDFEDPLKALVEKLKDVSDAIGYLILELSDVIMVIAGSDGLRQRNTFNPIFDQQNLALPVRQSLNNQTKPDVPLHIELAMVDRYVPFIIYSIIVCPELMRKDEVFNILKMVAMNHLLIPVCQNEFFPVHQELENLSSWYLAHGLFRVPKEDQRLKNLIKDMLKDAIQYCGLYHREMRSYLRGELQNLVNLFTISPGLIAPKFLMVFSCVSMARAEIIWYYSHATFQVPKNLKKDFQEQHFVDPSISTLIRLVYELIECITSNTISIQKYFLEYLKGAQRQAIDAIISELLGQNQVNFSAGVNKLLNSFVPLLDGLDIEKPQDANLQGFRLNWCRAAAIFSETGSKNAWKSEGIQKLGVRMNLVYWYSRFADDLPNLLKEFVELTQCWWMRDIVFGAENEKILTVLNDSSPQDIIAYFKIIASAKLAITNYVPELQQAIMSDAKNITNALAASISRYVEHMIHSIYGRLTKSNQQILPKEYTRRLQRRREAKKKGDKTQQVSEPMPGYESHISFNPNNYELIWYLNRITYLLGSIEKFQKINILCDEVDIKLFIRQRVEQVLDRQVELIFAHHGIERPSVFLNTLSFFCSVLQSVLSAIDIDITGIVREKLFGMSQTVESQFDIGSQLTLAEPLGDSSAPIAHRYANFFLKLISDKDVATQHISVIYTEENQGFIYLPRSPPKGINIELFMDKQELEALCTLIGPQGCSILDAALLYNISSQVNHIKEIISQNRNSLVDLRQSYFNENWMASIQTMQGVDAMVRMSIEVGNLMRLRKLLHLSVRDVLSRKAPLIFDAVDSMWSSLRPKTIVESSISSPVGAFTLMAQNYCGIESASVDPSLWAALRKDTVSQQDQITWELLGVAFASAFYCQEWKRADYLPRFDVYLHNHQTMILTLTSLMYCFNNRVNDSDYLLNLCEEFVRISAFILLNMKRHEQTTTRDYPFRSASVFLEKFVQGCPCLARDILEKYMPYSILHSCYVDMSLGRKFAHQKVTSTIAAVEESKEDVAIS